MNVYLHAVETGIKIATSYSDQVIRRMARPGSDVIGVITTTTNEDARKIRRVLEKAWSRHRLAGGVFDVSEAEIARVLDYLAGTHLKVLRRNKPISTAGKRLVLNRFARGVKAHWRAKDFGRDRDVLDELLVAGALTLHSTRRDGWEYRGTGACLAIVQEEAKGLVPEAALAEMVDGRPLKLTQWQMLPDPSMTDAEFFHQRNLKPDAPDIGKEPAMVNLIELIGGLARMPDERNDVRDATAGKFKAIYEMAQIGGAKAVDYGAVRVDTSGPTEDAVYLVGERSRQEMREAMAVLGPARAAVLEKIIVLDLPLIRVARGLGYGSGGAGRDRAKRNFIDALDVLSAHYRLVARKLHGIAPARENTLEQPVRAA